MSVQPEMAAAYPHGRSHVEYARALSHSRRVRILKYLLPVLSVIVIVGFAGVSWIGTVLPEGIAIQSTAIEDGKIVMRNPVMTGQNNSEQPYSLKASRAVQDLATPDLIVLEDIVADMPVSDSVSATLTAPRGSYDRAAERMAFTEPFRIETSSGMSAELQTAEVDIAAGSMVSNSPVSVTSPEASIVAQSMRMQDKGRSVVFETGVRMTITPNAVRAAAEAPTNDSGTAAQ
ncbi:lipopolysaccharide export system protein LptC [Hoeflea marina]|uniref:Lipopolysaccharide export system protein LptC n=2 Tax=Hoeflea marina TaxID=274592 RepID=A0A317PJW0_9HYPH|nr:lipopolysaccharide export system protein LptC [Hoeflea marina]